MRLVTVHVQLEDVIVDVESLAEDLKEDDTGCPVMNKQPNDQKP